MIYVLVQASSRSWQGWKDFCTNHADGKPAVQYTVDKFLNLSPEIKVTLIAPKFDHDGIFPSMFEHYDLSRFQLHFSHDASPLLRMVAATEQLTDNDYFIRVDGLHFAVLEQEALTMLSQAKSQNLDCVKFPDDFPIQLTADIYKVGSLRKLTKQALSPALSVHAKYAMLSEPQNWKIGYLPEPSVTNNYLIWARRIAQGVYVANIDSNMHSNSAGDLHTFHYELAKPFLTDSNLVLDCSCGDGTGSHLLSNESIKVIGGDIDTSQIDIAETKKTMKFNGEFQQIDITDIPYQNESFDAVVCMETIEHVDEHKCLSEIYRVLKPSGLALFSTPQNALGHIPINPQHNKEYSLNELLEACSGYFTIEEIIGIKQGKIIIKDSNKGSNMLIVCRKAP